MNTGLIEGVDPHQRDADVVKAIAAAKKRLGGSRSTIFAVKNEAGKVYRRFELSGLQQEMYLAERLEPLGLVDETEQGGRRPKGIWAVYGAGRDLSLNAILNEARKHN